jgi:hypothetical protein
VRGARNRKQVGRRPEIEPEIKHRGRLERLVGRAREDKLIRITNTQRRRTVSLDDDQVTAVSALDETRANHFGEHGWDDRQWDQLSLGSKAETSASPSR